MKETSKAQRRRCHEASEGKFNWDDIFKGNGIDVGSGDDPLTDAIPFNLPDGGGDDLHQFFTEKTFDYIHGSNVLEHALDPKVMLQSWLDCLKPGGYIVATVPDWELYEKKIWPSRFNAGHRTRWTMNTREAIKLHMSEESSDMILMPSWLDQFPVEILLCRLIDTSDHSRDPMIDQTYYGVDVEVFIEFVLRKK